ncbi:MAG: SMI1/KNR4 family protein [Planctomycetota bacterium]|nr:MAG: SMI1/KNR4 family protein [Planctomycetota bacterium]
MNQERLAQLHQRYVALYSEEPTRGGGIAELQALLDVSLPDEMQAIAEFYSGGIVGGISHNSFDPEPAAASIAKTTLSFRSAINLPYRFIVLAELDESVIVLDVESEVVTWCDNCDVSRLDGSSEMLGKTETWPSYADFFEFCLDEEEEERRYQ